LYLASNLSIHYDVHYVIIIRPDRA